jgi:hypothetical protein
MHARSVETGAGRTPGAPAPRRRRAPRGVWKSGLRARLIRSARTPAAMTHDGGHRESVLLGGRATVSSLHGGIERRLVPSSRSASAAHPRQGVARACVKKGRHEGCGGCVPRKHAATRGEAPAGCCPTGLARSPMTRGAEMRGRPAARFSRSERPEPARRASPAAVDRSGRASPAAPHSPLHATPDLHAKGGSTRPQSGAELQARAPSRSPSHAPHPVANHPGRYRSPRLRRGVRKMINWRTRRSPLILCCSSPCPDGRVR